MPDHQEQAAAAADEERYGSGLAQMFGFVTTEDRQKWQQNRQMNMKRVSTAKSTMKTGVGSMMEFSDKNMGAKLNAAHRMAEQETFDTTHDKITHETKGPNGTVIQSTEYADKGESEEIEPDIGY